MIFQAIKKTLLNKKLDTLLSQSDGGKTIPMHKIRSVGILTTEEISSEIDLKQEIETILKVRNARMFSLRKFSKIDEFSHKHFTEKDINWRGKFTHNSFQIFLEEPLDLLIGYFNTSDVFLESAVLQSKAQLKVGFTGANSKLYEIEILEKTANVTAFSSELKRYLQIIKKL